MAENLEKIAALVDARAQMYVRSTKNNPWCPMVVMRFDNRQDAELVRDLVPVALVSQEKYGQQYFWLNYEYRSAGVLLQQIVPFLVKMRPQAMIILELEKFKQMSRAQKQTEEVKKSREQLLTQLVAENKAQLKEKLGEKWKN